MALVKCPECGRENVSDTAIACPSCGYNIKKHFENKTKQEEGKNTDATQWIKRLKELSHRNVFLVMVCIAVCVVILAIWPEFIVLLIPLLGAIAAFFLQKAEEPGTTKNVMRFCFVGCILLIIVMLGVGFYQNLNEQANRDNELSPRTKKMIQWKTYEWLEEHEDEIDW